MLAIPSRLKAEAPTSGPPRSSSRSSRQLATKARTEAGAAASPTSSPKLLVEECILHPGTAAVCIREVQRTLTQSAKRLIEQKIEALGVGAALSRLRRSHQNPRRRSHHLRRHAGSHSGEHQEPGGLPGSPGSKRRRRSAIAASRCSGQQSASKDSEIWASWNPRRKSDAIDEFLRSEKPDRRHRSRVQLAR